MKRPFDRLLKLARKTSKSERGIALVFVLGMLVLLSVLAVSFASMSIDNRRAAANNNNQSSARILARSALERVMGALNYYSSLGGSFDDFFTHDSDNPVTQNRENYDWLWRLNTKTADGMTVYGFPSSYNHTDSGAVHWQYVTNGKNGTGNCELIGRFAYAIVRDGGKLDPSACVDTDNLNEDSSPPPRIGKYVDEISLKDLDTGILTTAIASDMSAVGAGGKLPNNTRWPDFEKLFNEVGVSSTSDKDQFKSWFQMSSTADPEAFWQDENSDGKKSSPEYFHRFDLTQSQAAWDSMTVAHLTSDSQLYDNTYSASTNGMRWLNKWLATGDMGSATACKNQVAANIIDYCDSNSTPTSDSADWTTTSPSYCGLEKVPYINELSVELNCSGLTSGSAGAWTLSFTLTPTVRAEIIDMYGLSAAAHSDTIDVYGHLVFKLPGDAAYRTIDFTMTPRTLDLSASAWTAGYRIGSDGIPAYNASVASAAAVAPAWEITELDVYIDRVILKHDGVNADFAGPCTAATTTSTTVNGSGTTIYFTWNTADPRQNTKASDWTFSSSSGIFGTYGTFGAKNPNGDPSAGGGDTETATDAAYLGTGANQHVSTAYIRNAPMLSPWELGCIHRGEKWKTLNLLKYKPAASSPPATYNSGGNAYTDGDANILDQIKMTDETSGYGKVNVNSSNADVLRVLFQNIYVKYDDNVAGTRIYQDPGEQLPYDANRLVDSVDATTLATALRTACTGGGAFKSRAEIVRPTNGMAKIYDATVIAQNTDAEKEEIIGKMVNLTKAESVDLVTVIVLAQTIKDTGKPTQSGGALAASGSTLYKDWNNDGDTSDATLGDNTAKYNAGYRTDAGVDIDVPTVSETIADCKKNQYDLGADQITSEQKIMALLSFDGISKWRIEKLEFVDE